MELNEVGGFRWALMRDNPPALPTGLGQVERTARGAGGIGWIKGTTQATWRTTRGIRGTTRGTRGNMRGARGTTRGARGTTQGSPGARRWGLGLSGWLGWTRACTLTAVGLRGARGTLGLGVEVEGRRWPIASSPPGATGRPTSAHRAPQAATQGQQWYSTHGSRSWPPAQPRGRN